MKVDDVLYQVEIPFVAPNGEEGLSFLGQVESLEKIEEVLSTYKVHQDPDDERTYGNVQILKLRVESLEERKL